MRRAAALLAARLAASGTASTSGVGSRSASLAPAATHARCLIWTGSRGSPAWRPPPRAVAFHTSAGPGKNDDTDPTLARSPAELVAEAKAVLEHASNVHLLEWVRSESRTRFSMPLDELTQRAAVWAPTPAAAAASVAALHDAGVVLRWRQTVFLRPAEVADTVLRALPDTDLEVRQRLDALKSELAPLADRKKAVDAAARRRSRAVMWAGFGLLAAQWSYFAYLTWGHPHWSWDDVEPFTYFFNSSITILAYSYYILARRALDFTSVDDHLRSTYASKRYADAGVDLAEYERLAADVKRYEAYAARFGDGTVVAKDEDED